MTLPASGAISLSQVNQELGQASPYNQYITLGDAAVRNLFNVWTNPISMSDGYGKANQFSFTISSNQTNANLRTLAINAGWNQSSKVVATINSGVYLSSNDTNVDALTINGSFPGGVQLINNGTIVGRGGAGGNGQGAPYTGGSNGGAGGRALNVATAVTITNNGTIAGGGGGGAGGYGYYYLTGGKDSVSYNYGGGGGGGGKSSMTNSTGGSGGTAGGATFNYPGAGGNGGTISAIGSGGSGGAGFYANHMGGNGGQWGAAGVSTNVLYGGAGGAAVSGNSNITWLATGTRLGAIA